MCYMLQESGWIMGTKNVIAPEQVGMFLSILSHYKKNCIVKHDFMRSGRTVSKHFMPCYTASVNCIRFSWQSRYLLQRIVSTLSGSGLSWEGSAANNRVLRDAIHRDDGLCVPSGNYYLCDNGYTNAKGFLTSYRGVRYHLCEWDRGTGGP
ncbi:UNVERIFIED_CONTAM: hypothetical protein Sangu_1010400 [Sesamum angustifolium]|uniref:DUF8040 domain-containing protein n=1 Tax=Sesamum angustifolium TaxID=2727405 RepID=A0AAW2PI35_9LAMI